MPAKLAYRGGGMAAQYRGVAAGIDLVCNVWLPEMTASEMAIYGSSMKLAWLLRNARHQCSPCSCVPVAWLWPASQCSIVACLHLASVPFGVAALQLSVWRREIQPGSGWLTLKTMLMQKKWLGVVAQS